MQRYTQLFGKTIKQAPKDAAIASHKLLYQAGFIRESSAGRYYFLPLGWKVHEKIRAIIKDEIDKTGAQEMIAPVLHPKSLWEETNRTSSVGFELMTITDRNKTDFVLGGTAEEMFVDLVRKFQLSYKDLPFIVYQFSTKFRDELRARGGLLRMREFVMKDAYSFDATQEAFEKVYEEMKQAYTAIYTRCKLHTVIVASDNGYIGGDYCHEFIVESEEGESKFFMTADGTYAAHEDIAVCTHEIKNIDEIELPLTHVKAVRGTTMEDGEKLHGLPMWQQIKDVMMVDEKGRMILAVIRGDYDVNEVKLLHVSNAYQLRHATVEEIRALGTEPGFISPVGIQEKASQAKIDLLVVGDLSLRTIKNAYTGNNALHEDLMHVNIDRDYTVDIEADIALAKEGCIAPNGLPLLLKKGIEVGNIFQLGYYYTSKMEGGEFTDHSGKKEPYYMGCYGIGLARTLATVVEKHHDEKGIIWPKAISPFDIHFIALTSDGGKTADTITLLEKASYDVLWDDRNDVTAGEKFADADLIGIPYRMILSDKTIKEGKVELKERDSDKSKLMTIGEAIQYMRSI